MASRRNLRFYYVLFLYWLLCAASGATRRDDDSTAFESYGGQSDALHSDDFEERGEALAESDSIMQTEDSDGILAYPEQDFEDASLMVFDKKRHFEVSGMIEKASIFDEDSIEYPDPNGETKSRRKKFTNPSFSKLDNLEIKKDRGIISVNKNDYKKQTKPLNRKRSYKDPESGDSSMLYSFNENSRARKLSEEVSNNASKSLSRGQNGRRQGSSLRELASRRHKNKQARDGMLNDRHEGDDDKGSLTDSYSGTFDRSAISYTDKIRALNSRLNDPYYESSPNNVGSAPDNDEIPGLSCDFESPCAWHWNITGSPQGFQILTADDIVSQNTSNDHPISGPEADADSNEKGHFLYLAIGLNTTIMSIRSPVFFGIMENCKVEMELHESNMQNASLKLVTEPDNAPPWVLSEMTGNNNAAWGKNSIPIGRVQQQFRIVLEVVPGALSGSGAAHFALDNLRMASCFAERATVDHCSPGQLECVVNKIPTCIKSSRVCDIIEDCDHGEDEKQDCDKTPFGARCSFEDGWCGWINTPTTRLKLKWTNHTGPTPTDNTGPDSDHTCLNARPGSNTTCRYLYVNMAQHGKDNGVGFASNANLDSVVFNPPPHVHGDVTSKYYNSCVVRFYFHQYGKNSGSISLLLIELKDKENSSSLIWRSSRNRGPDWVRTVVILPNVTTRYYLQFETRRGMRIYSDVAIDDFSMAPECFGLNIPPVALGDYNYWDPIHSEAGSKPHRDFQNSTYLELSTCGTTGRVGPSQQQCESAYRNTSLQQAVHVLTEESLRGVQAWTVPTEGHYTVIVHGAGGGLGSGGTGSSRGASARALLELHKGQVLYALVGQQGTSACIKTLSVLTESNCKHLFMNQTEMGSAGIVAPYHSKTHEIKNTVIQDGGGGGGGGTFLFMLNKQRQPVPLMVAGGGGGLGAGRAGSGGSQHGRAALPSHKRPRTGNMYGAPHSTPGAGGGWLPAPGLVTPGHEEVRGAALQAGGAGGRACSGASGGPGAGGFGGGGGGCARGGAAGGWAGGDTSQNMSNGEGGFSFVEASRAVPGFTDIQAASHSGPGQVIIIPAIHGCGCDYRCVALDEYRSRTQCICPPGWVVTGVNLTLCELMDEWAGVPYLYVMVVFGIISLLLVGALTGVFLILYNRYQVRKQAAIRHKALLEQDLRLSRLRSTADDSALTSFNPNYGCDAVLAGGVDVRQLPQVARDSLRLVKALGQGAFGEVYQGLYRHRDGDAIEMPVAVKTLPEMSTGQSETDFLMEAAIMAKFNHPNIVHLIGVCFDRHPRFIVLELLAGGDLKNFLRENRPKPERSSSLSMKDLVLCALDVAKGCRYMETKRFIHRDIAARNCLLTSKGPGRVVKIADFGMARDIYRADYYRKGGKAMLPIKWMPPEAFLDGIFTSKTDVWSFGVLLWEVFSLGIMPYTGCANREVMQMVTGGGRLDIPHGCPIEIYRMMCDCWNPTPQDRPSFSQLFERLTHCTQDPELMGAPLPCFSRTLPLPRDADLQGHTLQQAAGVAAPAPQAADYLVPMLPLVSIGSRVPTVASSSSDRLLQSLHSAEEEAAADGGDSEQHTPKQTYKQMHLPEYGNIALTPRPTPAPAPVQPCRSTERLLASMDDDDRQWETSFSEPRPDKEHGPPVDKLISIDTPQQTPTSLQPPDNSLSRTIYQNRNQPTQESPAKKAVTTEQTRKSTSPPYKKTVLPVNYIKTNYVSLDAAQLEQNLNALKKNSGCVNLNNMNILPPYVNVLTPSKLTKLEIRNIKIDPKKARIHDLASPPGVETYSEAETPTELVQENRLKASGSANSLLNGPLTDLPYADSDNASSSSSTGNTNMISRPTPGSKENNYTETDTPRDNLLKKVMKKENTNGGFLNNDSEISC